MNFLRLSKIQIGHVFIQISLNHLLGGPVYLRSPPGNVSAISGRTIIVRRVHKI